MCKNGNLLKLVYTAKSKISNKVNKTWKMCKQLHTEKSVKGAGILMAGEGACIR